MSVQQHLTTQVQNHEHYIRSAGVHIPRGKHGDYEYAEYELLEHAQDADSDFDQWGFDLEQAWFVNLVWRQAKCNAQY